MKAVTTIVFGIFYIAFGFAQEPELEISDDIFLDVYYDKDEFIPTEEGQKVIDFVGKSIMNNKTLSKYSFFWGVSTCKYEKADNPYIEYKRVEYLLDYLEKEYEISRWKFQFSFGSSDFCDDNQQNRVSLFSFSLTGCE